MHYSPVKTILSALFFAALILPARADTLYVNNNTAYPAEYRTFDDAFAAAADGDTILLAGSTTSYGNILIVGKAVKLVGNKSFNSAAPGQPARADEETTKIGSLKIGHDSVTATLGDSRLLANGTIVESLEANTILHATIWSDGCTIRGCNFRGISIYGSGNIVAGSRFSSFGVSMRRRENSTVSPTYVAAGTGNQIQNCLILSDTGDAIETAEFTSAVFTHCTIGVRLATDDSYDIDPTSTLTLRNCIINDSEIGNSGVNRVKNQFNNGATRLHHCLITSAFGDGDGGIPELSEDLNNLVTTSSSLVFSDNFYNSLKVGSPAIGSGEGGVDMGITGGPTPYEYGGSPSLPLINKLNILSANPTTGLTFKVEAEARD